MMLMANSICCQIEIQDGIVTHTNQTFYITGDVIKLKAYLPASFDGKEIVIRRSLLSNTAELVEDAFLRTDKNQILSSVQQVPLDLTSGIYSLVLSSYNKKLKKEITLVDLKIPIYADLSDDLELTNESNASDHPDLIPTDAQQAIQLESSSLSRREKGKSKFVSERLADLQDISLTINDSQLGIPEYTSLHISAPIAADIIESLSSKIYIHGKVSETENKQAKKFPVISVYLKAENRFDYIQTENDGSFFFEFEDFDGTKDLQFINYNNENITVEIFHPEVSSTQLPLIVNESILEILSHSRKRKKINQLFDVSNQLETNAQTEWSKSPNLDGKVYDFSKYESFESLSSFFDEILAGLKFREQEDGSFIAQVFNRDRASRGYYKGKPVFVVDGAVTKNATFINDLDYSKLNSIEIISDLETLRKGIGPIGLSGLVYISTALPELRIPDQEADDKMSINGFSTSSSATAETEVILDNSTPLLGSNIYWLDKSINDVSKDAVFEFSHTDDLGEFEIELVGRYKNGEFFRTTTQYSVK